MRTSRMDTRNRTRARAPRRLALATTLLAITLITPAATVRPAAASGLDVNAVPTIMRVDRTSGSWNREYRPIRHRRPRGYGSSYGSRPEYYATLGIGAFDPSNQPGSGLLLNGSVGSTVAQQLDLGLQLSWYHRSTGGSEFVREYKDPAGITRRDIIQTSSIDTDLVPIMATLRARFPLSGGIEPYVGGGIGWEWLTVEGTDLDGASFRDDYDGFGAQAIAGMNFDLSPEVGIYGEAVWNISTVSADFLDPLLAATIHEEVNFDGVGFHTGLRFRF